MEMNEWPLEFRSTNINRRSVHWKTSSFALKYNIISSILFSKDSFYSIFDIFLIIIHFYFEIYICRL